MHMYSRIPHKGIVFLIVQMRVCRVTYLYVAHKINRNLCIHARCTYRHNSPIYGACQRQSRTYTSAIYHNQHIHRERACVKGRKSFRSFTSFTNSVHGLPGKCIMFISMYTACEKHQMHILYAKPIYLHLLHSLCQFLSLVSCFRVSIVIIPFARTMFDVVMLGKCVGFIFTLGKTYIR